MVTSESKSHRTLSLVDNLFFFQRRRMGDKYGSNIFELLSEDSNKKQKQQQKKENVPKADNKAKKEGAKAPVKANNAAKAPQQPKGNGRGRGEGRGRGRGRGPRPDGRNFPVDGEQQQRQNNRGRQVSRRQRDESAKRGDYGAPDAEGRQKRPYDKFSHSAGARRKQEKKGGAGAGNWGTKGQVPEEAPVAEEEEKKEFEEAPVVDEIVEDVEGEEEVAPEEEEDNEIDYDTFVERKKKEDEELSKLIQTDVRKVDAGEYKDLKTFSKSGEPAQLVPLNGKKKGKKASKADSNKGVSVDQILDVRAPAQENNNRRKGRQNNRNNQRPQKRDVKLALGDDKDFPSLGK